jgi:hypothetical protein
MKNSHLASIVRSTLIACTLMIGTLASTQSASAQSPEALATVNIPFAFRMGNQTMPAGMYSDRSRIESCSQVAWTRSCRRLCGDAWCD